MTIKTNFKNIFLRFVMLVILAAILYLMIDCEILHASGKKGIGILYFMCALIALLLLRVLLTFFEVVEVRVDVLNENITFIRFFSKTTVTIQNITGYYVSTYRTRLGTKYGRIIKTNKGNTIRLKPIDLLDISTIDQYLQKPTIDFLGEIDQTFSNF